MDFAFESALSCIGGEEKKTFLDFVRRMLKWKTKNEARRKSYSVTRGFTTTFRKHRSCSGVVGARYSFGIIGFQADVRRPGGYKMMWTSWKR